MGYHYWNEVFWAGGLVRFGVGGRFNFLSQERWMWWSGSLKGMGIKGISVKRALGLE